MYKKGDKKILCPCTKCMNNVMYKPFRGTVLAHLLLNGFMPGYTRWIQHEEEEDVSEEDGGNNGDDLEEGGYDGGYEGGNEEMPEHDHADEHEEEEAPGTQESSLLASMVGDPHYQELF